MFWGIEMRQPVLAALTAVAVEASRWLKYRCDFSEADLNAVSTLCILALVGLALYQFFTGWFNHSAWMVLKWLPIVLLPLFLAQLYSTGGTINSSALYLFRRRKILTDSSQHRQIDLSYTYLATCIFSAGFANQQDDFFYTGMLVLAFWVLWPYRQRRSSLAAWFILMLVAGGTGYFGQIGLARLQTLVDQRTTHLFAPRGDTYRKFTQIGDIPNEKLSSRIVFRARTGGKDERSLLLREATCDT
jgi:hypothetical protein